MTYDLDEQEQLEAIKAWWAKWGNLILTVVTLVLLAVASWQAWNWYQRHQATQAAGVFEALQGAVRQQQPNLVLDASARLNDDFGRTAYADRGALLAASALAAAGDAEAASERLQWVIERNHSAFAPVARLRLATLHLDAGNAQAGLSILEGTAPEGFGALYADRRGDLLQVLGRADEAAAAWQQALNEIAAGDPLQSVVALKLEALAAAQEDA